MFVTIFHLNFRARALICYFFLKIFFSRLGIGSNTHETSSSRCLHLPPLSVYTPLQLHTHNFEYHSFLTLIHRFPGKQLQSILKLPSYVSCSPCFVFAYIHPQFEGFPQPNPKKPLCVLGNLYSHHRISFTEKSLRNEDSLSLAALSHGKKSVRTPTSSSLSVADESNQQASALRGRIVDVDLQSELSSSFVKYALSTILSRALPDSRDGLKPVQRRILWAMKELCLSPGGGFRKCARVVGEVLGKYHPHGDQAVYDALVRMSQDFVMAEPLVSGHGNFGSADKDPPAAMRYTECKLSTFSQEALLKDLNESVVDFISNFDGNEKEPVVFPSRFPLLLLNGASGIAVGMATNIPPHNLGELCDALTALISNPKVKDETLFKLVKGPDFPSGGIIVGDQQIKQLYSTGSGVLTLRAKICVCYSDKNDALVPVDFIISADSEKTSKAVSTADSSHGKEGDEAEENNRGETCTGEGLSGSADLPSSRVHSIVISELPFSTHKTAVIQRILQLMQEKKLEDIADLRDESNYNSTKIVITLKRNAQLKVCEANLLKMAGLQVSFAGNMVALFGDGKLPKRTNLRNALENWIDFRVSTLKKQLSRDLAISQDELHITEGLIKATKNIRRLVDTIQSSDCIKTARNILMSPQFSLTDLQVDHVLKLPLSRLTNLEVAKLKKEGEKLSEKVEKLKCVLDDEDKVMKMMQSEIDSIRSQYAKPRKTSVDTSCIAVKRRDDDLIPVERSVIQLTSSGYLKRMHLQDFEVQKRGTQGTPATVFPSSTIESDSSSEEASRSMVTQFCVCSSHDHLVCITEKGVAYTIKAWKIPLASKNSRGTPQTQLLPLSRIDRIVKILPIDKFLTGDYLVILSLKGFIKKTPIEALSGISSKGLKVAHIGEGDQLLFSQRAASNDSLIIATKRGMAIHFYTNEELLRSTTRRSRGVKGITLTKDDSPIGMCVIKPEIDNLSGSLLMITRNGYGKQTKISEFRPQLRGGKGVAAIAFKARSVGDELVALEKCGPPLSGKELIISTAGGKVLRQSLAKVPMQRRSSTGVRLQKLQKSDFVRGIAVYPQGVA